MLARMTNELHAWPTDELELGERVANAFLYSARRTRTKTARQLGWDYAWAGLLLRYTWHRGASGYTSRCNASGRGFTLLSVKP